MAACSRRSLTSGFTLISRRYLQLPLSYFLPSSHDRDQSKSQPQAPPSSNPQTLFRSPIQSGSRTLCFSPPLGLDPFRRSYSSSPSSAAMDGSNEIGFIKDDVLIDPAAIETSSSAAAASVPLPFAGEVAAAAADSYPPVAALQYLIDAVHSISGVNWWLSIALTTLLIRSATVPLLVYQMKATTKLSAIRPQMEELKERAQSSMDPQVMRENQKKMQELFKKHGVNPFTPLMGLFIQGPVFISFFMAISNMVEKVPSFKGGGAYWFTDLTTPDPFYALPVLTGLTFLATVELNMQEGMEGNPMAATMKKFSRGLAVLSVPFTASFPKAIFCYWVTSNLFSLVYGFVIKHKPVRKFLNLPIITPPSDSGPAFSLGEPKGGPPDSGPGNGSSSTALPAAGSEPKRISSSAIINQRIRNLEKQVKGRNKPPKKR